ncbi:hypothetical protein AB0M44_45055 [Streptosporangium subroseum]|uniref:hypothetical protein n=1 Tax=Streptosporangium subroseum TaxID=106412 RepID=UPI003446E9D5
MFCPGRQTALQTLVDALNAQVGASTYKAPAHLHPGTDQIHVTLICKPAKVQLVGAARSSTGPVIRRSPAEARAAALSVPTQRHGDRPGGRSRAPAPAFAEAGGLRPA